MNRYRGDDAGGEESGHGGERAVRQPRQPADTVAAGAARTQPRAHPHQQTADEQQPPGRLELRAGQGHRQRPQHRSREHADEKTQPPRGRATRGQSVAERAAQNAADARDLAAAQGERACSGADQRAACKGGIRGEYRPVDSEHGGSPVRVSWGQGRVSAAARTS